MGHPQPRLPAISCPDTEPEIRSRLSRTINMDFKKIRSYSCSEATPGLENVDTYEPRSAGEWVGDHRDTVATRRFSAMDSTTSMRLGNRLGGENARHGLRRLQVPLNQQGRRPSMVHSVFSDFMHEPESPCDTIEMDLRQGHGKGECIEMRKKSMDSSHSGSIRRPAGPPFHVFSNAKKKRLVGIVSLAGLFSPLSSNIYFPALSAISADLKVHVALVSLTITVYMVMQGLAPSFWGPVSDTKGRRFTFIGTFAVYLVANIGLALSRNLASLMVFRGIQAAGSAATIAIGAGVIGDITTAKERGGFIGQFGGIRMMGQSIGPVLGGVITELFGFRAIFWFLFALGAITLLLILFFLPETLRRVAGNGSVPLRGIHRPWICFLKPDDLEPAEGNAQAAPAPRITLASILSPLRFLFEKDVFVTLFFGAVVYAVWSMVTSSTTFLFQSRFHLTGIEVGLVFLPNGLGCVAGSLLTGRLLDRDYRVVEAEYRARKQLPAGARLNRKELVDFPLARCRLRSAGYLAALFAIAVGAYGFVVSSRALIKSARMAISLFLQFVIAYTATGIFTQNSALVVDLYPGASASATAVSNLMRCSVGAGGVAAVQFIIDGMGAGATFLMLGLVTAALTPLLWFELEWGDQWRQERTTRLERERSAQDAVDGGEMGCRRAG